MKRSIRIRLFKRCNLLLVFLLVLLLCIGFGCGDENDWEDDSQFDYSGPLILDQYNHEQGYGSRDCLLCHQTFTIHDSIDDPDIDVQEIDDLIEQSGESACIFCHGTNGT